MCSQTSFFSSSLKGTGKNVSKTECIRVASPEAGLGMHGESVTKRMPPLRAAVSFEQRSMDGGWPGKRPGGGNGPGGGGSGGRGWL